jgi:hypothetical protein
MAASKGSIMISKFNLADLDQELVDVQAFKYYAPTQALRSLRLSDGSSVLGIHQVQRLSTYELEVGP